MEPATKHQETPQDEEHQLNLKSIDAWTLRDVIYWAMEALPRDRNAAAIEALKALQEYDFSRFATHARRWSILHHISQDKGQHPFEPLVELAHDLLLDLKPRGDHGAKDHDRRTEEI